MQPSVHFILVIGELMGLKNKSQKTHNMNKKLLSLAVAAILVSHAHAGDGIWIYARTKSG